MRFDQQNILTIQSDLRWVVVDDNQVLIQNYAVSLNTLDFKMANMNFSKTILPAVTGYDVSGPVVAVGKNVKIGDDVFGFLNIEYSGGGTLQQYTVGEADGLIEKPAGVNHTEAATLGIAVLSAMDS